MDFLYFNYLFMSAIECYVLCKSQVNEKLATMSMWTPRLRDSKLPIYLKIADAIQEDVDSGRLAAGARLPPHRDLAYELGTTAVTIGRAYAEAARRGLVAGEVGRGTFVRAVQLESDMNSELVVPDNHLSNVVDLGLNLSTVGESDRFLQVTLSELSRRADLSTLLEYKPAGGMPEHRSSAARWIARSGVAANANDVIICSGAQHGLLISLLALTRAGDSVLTESVTYPGMRALAHQFNLELQGVKIDEQGLIPDCLESACKAGHAKILYCMPILQNPTTATMSEERCRQIARIAERHGLWIIEDDVYGFLVDDPPPRLATLLPERTIYISSASKSMAPGLRIGFIRTPPELIDTMVSVARMSDWMTAPLMAEIAHRWIDDGEADRLAAWHRRQARHRQAIAATRLGDIRYSTQPSSYHLWLHLPKNWRMDIFTDQALRRGVKVLSAEAFAIRRDIGPHAVRVCLGSVDDEEQLASALDMLAKILAAPAPPITTVV